MESCNAWWYYCKLHAWATIPINTQAETQMDSPILLAHDLVECLIHHSAKNWLQKSLQKICLILQVAIAVFSPVFLLAQES